MAEIPAFDMPFAARLSPHADRVRQHTKTWVRDMGMLGGVPWTEAFYDAADYGGFGPLTHPTASLDALLHINDWHTWGFYVSDAFLEGFLRTRNVVGGKAFVARLKAVLAGSAPTNPAERGLADLVSRSTLDDEDRHHLTEYLDEHGIRVRYLHSDIETVERMEIIRDLRLGEFDVLVGINLLREGLDIPEVSLVAVLDADKEGFLRAERSLIQTIGRAARHLNGMAILYADTMTDSMKAAIGETERRRTKQMEFNVREGITPKGVQKRIKDLIDGVYDAESSRRERDAAKAKEKYERLSEKDMERELKTLEKQMMEAAKNLEFERAAELRDRLYQLKEKMFGVALPTET